MEETGDTPNRKEDTRSIVAASIKDGVEDEKCVVSQYRTTVEQKQKFIAHLETCESKNYVSIEWVIDIADEKNGWFYGTGYHYDDSTQMLHVMVPDKENPSFDGHVLLDHRTVHLIECVDDKTDALFNKIVRDSVIKVKWDVDWFEESEDGSGEVASWAADGTTGSWVHSSARYYIRIANQLLVEDKDQGQETRGFVIITADMNLKLLACVKNKGIEDFHRLINEGIVQSTPEAQAAAQAAGSPRHPAGAGASTGSAEHGRHSSSSSSSHNKRHDSREDMKGGAGAGGGFASARRLSDMSRGLRECVVDLLDDRDRMKEESNNLATMFEHFALNGDLDDGLKLLDHFQVVKAKADKHSSSSNVGADVDDAEDKMEAIVDDAMYLSQKIERSLNKIVRAGAEVPNNAEEEIEALKRNLKNVRKELDEKEAALEALRGTVKA